VFNKHVLVFLQSSNVENLSPQIIRNIAKEVAGLTKDPPEGIKVIPNEEDITDIQANIEGPGIFFNQIYVINGMKF
jgi:ubiquitin-protein ligase